MMSEKKIYSSVDDVIRYAGIKPSDFWLEDNEEETAEEQLQDIVMDWLVQIKNKIDLHQRVDYFHETEKEDGIVDEVPESIHDIAKRMTANKITSTKLKREAPIQKVEDYSIRQVEDKIFTKSILRELKDVPNKRNIIRPF